MPVFDREQQKIVLRVVYDGPARAGKTTNVEQLQGFFTRLRRGELVSPKEMGGRTLYFDWMDFDGGLVAGQSLRCQFVTVPGQRKLAARRKNILQTADVVVFVCSSAARAHDKGRSMLESLRWALRTSGREGVPLIVQANKQDLKTALPPERVRAALRLPEDVPVVGAVAHTGVGVRETSVLAIRAAASQVEQVLMERGLDQIMGRAQTSDELFEDLKGVGDDDTLLAGEMVEELIEDELDEDEALPAPVTVGVELRKSETPRAFAAPSSAGSSRQEMASGSLPPPVDGTSADSASDGASDAAPPADPSTEVADGASPVGVADESPPNVSPPRPQHDVPSGFVWPSTTGRSILRSLAGKPLERRAELAGRRGTEDGSGSCDVMIFRAGPWCLKTSLRRRFESTDDGRNALLEVARRKIRLGGLLPPNTVVSAQVGEEGECWLWTVTPWMRTLRAEMTEAARHSDDEPLGVALAKFARAAVGALGLASVQDVVLDVHPSNFVSDDDAVFYIDDDIGEGSSVPSIGHALLQRVEEFGDRPEAVSHYLDVLESELEAHLPRDELRRTGFIDSLDSVIARHPEASRAQRRLVERFQARPSPGS